MIEKIVNLILILYEKLEKYKAQKGVLTLIKSEIYENLNSIILFKEKYLKYEFSIYEIDENSKEIINFYNQMIHFPNLNNYYWKNSINFTTLIFKHEDIEKIDIFYNKCNELSRNAEFLFESSEPEDLKFGKYKIPYNPNPNIINNHRNEFRAEINEVIKMGDEIKKIFEEYS